MSVGVTRVGGWFDYFRAAGLAGYLARHAGAVTHFFGGKQRAYNFTGFWKIPIGNRLVRYNF